MSTPSRHFRYWHWGPRGCIPGKDKLCHPKDILIGRLKSILRSSSSIAHVVRQKSCNWFILSSIQILICRIQSCIPGILYLRSVCSSRRHYIVRLEQFVRWQKLWVKRRLRQASWCVIKYIWWLYLTGFYTYNSTLNSTYTIKLPNIST